jgi:serine/threonine protein kinase
MAALEGKTLNDRYVLQRLIGRGGMADVYEGEDQKFGRKVAVKIFKREDEDMLHRFIREAQLMGRLTATPNRDNEHLVSIYDSGSAPVDGITCYYIIMPHMEGGTLRARIRRSPLPLREACEGLRQIAGALDYIHSQGIFHRDIKASNVLLDAQGNYYLADFGIARRSTDATQLTTTGNVLGTVDYIAPELFETNHKADAKSDLYSLGVLLFEMVTGQLPFTAESQIAVVSMHVNNRPPSPRSISQQITPQIERVVLKGLEKKPEQRYANATEFAEAFCRAINKNEGQERNNIFRRASTGAIDGAVGLKATVPASVSPIPPLPIPDQPKIRLSPLAGSAETPPFVPPTQPVPPSPIIPPQPRKPRRSRSISRRHLLISFSSVFVVLLMLIFSIFLIGNNTHRTSNTGGTTATQTAATTGGQTATLSPSPTPNLTATAQAQANATATAQVQATATARAQATATAQAQASATAGVIQTATSGTPTYQDGLNDSKNAATIAAAWDGVGGSDPNCVFQSDGYHVIQDMPANQHACHEQTNQYTSATVRVDMTILKGHSGGLFLRFRTTVFNSYRGYMFEIDTQGQYKVSIFGQSTPLQDWKASPALNKGYNVINTLQVIMRGNVFNVYANGAFLTTIPDSDSSLSTGAIALFAFTSDTDPATEVVFKNLAVF